MSNYDYDRKDLVQFRTLLEEALSPLRRLVNITNLYACKGKIGALQKARNDFFKARQILTAWKELSDDAIDHLDEILGAEDE